MCSSDDIIVLTDFKDIPLPSVPTNTPPSITETPEERRKWKQGILREKWCGEEEVEEEVVEGLERCIRDVY